RSRFLRPCSTFDSLYSLISETSRRAKRRASSCFFASSDCGCWNAAPRPTPAGGTYCVVGRSSPPIDVGAPAAGAAGGTAAGFGAGAGVGAENSSAEGMLKAGAAGAAPIISLICAASNRIVCDPTDGETAGTGAGIAGRGAVAGPAAGAGAGFGGAGGGAGGGAATGAGFGATGAGAGEGAGAGAGTGFGAAGAGAAASEPESLRLGDGVFLRNASVSISRPVVKTSNSTDDVSSFATSSLTTSTYTAAATLSLITIGTRIAFSDAATPSRVERFAPSHTTTRSSRRTVSSSGMSPGAALKRFTFSSLPPAAVKPAPFHPLNVSPRRMRSAAREPKWRHSSSRALRTSTCDFPRSTACTARLTSAASGPPPTT